MTIKEYIKKNIDPNFDDILPFEISEKVVKKGFLLTDYQQIERNIYFIKEGIVEVSILEKGEEKILDFFFENSFFASYSSLLTSFPSDVSIKAYTNCTLEIIEYSELKKAYSHSLIANKLGRIETEKLYYKRVLREKELLTKTAEERYVSLLTHYPKIIEKIAVKDISRYLGIQPESLSRIRKKVIS